MQEDELPDLASFLREVAMCPNGVKSIHDDLVALHRYVGLPSDTGSFKRSDVEECLREGIAASFHSGHRRALQQFRSLRREILYTHVLDRTPLGADFAVVCIVVDALRSRQGTSDVTPRGDWRLAVQRAVEYETLRANDYSTQTSHIQIQFRRDLEVARAALRLRDKGYMLRREPGKIFIEPADEDRLVDRLQRIVACFPGFRVSQKLFSLLSAVYDSGQERYHYGRRPSQIGEGSPQIPINFLLQLCAKHASGKKPYRGDESSWRELIALSTDYAALFDVQPYSTFGLLFKDTKTLVPFLQELALYDSLFAITQTRPSDVMKLLRGLLGSLDPDQKRGSGWTLNDLFAVGDAILASGGARGSSFVSHASIAARCSGVDARIVKFALDEVFSHAYPGANQRFNKPTDAPEDALPREKRAGHDFFERPLLATRDGGFMLFEKALVAPAIIEAVFTVLRSTKLKNFESIVGEEMERFLRQELGAHGIVALQGDYDDSLGSHGECDIVIECPETVIFIEMKKQPLTRKAQAGSDTALLMDMAASLLLAQLQAGWHEIRIRRDGFLLLEKDGQRRRVELNGRAIERIAVTLFDYGGFQDRILLQQFLQVQLATGYVHVDPALQAKFDKINAQLEELRTQVNQLQPLMGQKGEAARFFNCWFLSIPQFLVLLDGVDSPAALRAALWNTRHASLGTLDFYFEHAHMKQLKG